MPPYHAPWGQPCFIHLSFPRTNILRRRLESLRFRERLLSQATRDLDYLSAAISRSYREALDHLDARRFDVEAREDALDLAEQPGLAIPLR